MVGSELSALYLTVSVDASNSMPTRLKLLLTNPSAFALQHICIFGSRVGM